MTAVSVPFKPKVSPGKSVANKQTSLSASHTHLKASFTSFLAQRTGIPGKASDQKMASLITCAALG